MRPDPELEQSEIEGFIAGFKFRLAEEVMELFRTCPKVPYCPCGRVLDPTCPIHGDAP